ncbi:hypothetical protein [Salinibacter ruber]|jgi:hypothetical protein|uniref:Uncharacterized protein n=1 Tax=Salinibacter ruber TaxID=146919 RepID=A0A9X2UL67_9BACT|nr:hypothetical protein [Salinibacter ruber]MBB4089619.1 hypothetical protein [Salinibacter ruber]MCS3610503.1 hypothetical protein [Salinibacter ruber]MCS3614653.1 hypothetical protein [Salinibacter ruber]MCS3645563.1 hypothetical protein [Salinibacter ruber]MCS3673336.1 hypothetical protein [Salinibacter ruber]
MIENELLREFAEAYPDSLESKLAQAFDEKLGASRSDAIEHLREQLESMLEDRLEPEDTSE